MTVLGFALAALAAPPLAALGVAKLLAIRAPQAWVWLPSRLGTPARMWASGAAAVYEIALATALILGALPHVLSVGIVLVTSVVVTTGGLLSITRQGSCGCGGHLTFPSERRALIRRNAALFGALALAAAFGPTTSELQAHTDSYVVALAGAPLMSFIALLGVRLVQRRLRSATIMRTRSDLDARWTAPRLSDGTGLPVALKSPVRSAKPVSG